MAISQTVRIHLDGTTPYETTFDGRDVRAWEEHAGRSALQEPMSLSMLTYLAWSAAHRQGHTTLDWDAFNAACSDVEGVTDRPTKPPRKAASPG